MLQTFTIIFEARYWLDVRFVLFIFMYNSVMAHWTGVNVTRVNAVMRDAATIFKIKPVLLFLYEDIFYMGEAIYMGSF